MESSDSPLMIPFKSKKPLLTTPKKKLNNNNNNNPPSMGPTDVGTPERVNPNPNTRIRNKALALSVSDVRKTALQLRKPILSRSDLPKVVPQKLCPTGVSKAKGSGNSSTFLPEKHEMLCEFFYAMMCSIRLLRRKNVPVTLTKIVSSIESLTDRRFTLHHLAQLKYIVPEVIVVKKTRVEDEKTKCMKEDLLVSLELDALETDKNAKGGGGGYSQFREIFRSRVTDLCKDRQDDDVPEGELPQLFYKLKQEPEPNMNKTSVLLTASLTAPSFKRRFSSRFTGAQVSESMSTKPLFCSSEITITEAASAEANDDGSFSTTDEANAACLDIASTPAKVASIPTKLDSTPGELASTPARLLAATPALRTPKRTLMTPEPHKSAKRRSLKFDESSVDFEEKSSQVDEEENILPKEDVLGLLPEDLLQSLREKERKMLKEKDPFEVLAKRRQQLMAGLPKLFDMISLLFQSINRSVITKEELIHKLLSGHLDIVDRSEVEEQLKLLQDVAPEYISEHQSLGGDTLLRLNKSSCSDSIRSMLLKQNVTEDFRAVIMRVYI